MSRAARRRFSLIALALILFVSTSIEEVCASIDVDTTSSTLDDKKIEDSTEPSLTETDGVVFDREAIPTPLPDDDQFITQREDVGDWSNDQDNHGHWGTPPSSSTSALDSTHIYNANPTHTKNHTSFIPKSKLSEKDTVSDSKIAKQMKSHNAQLNYEPPDAFVLSAQIITIKQQATSSLIRNDVLSIPFKECNSEGTTTPAIPIKNISFRSFPKSAHPSSFIFTKGFIVPLSKAEIKSSDGQIEIFEAGAVIWVDGEYQISSADDAKDLSVLIANTRIQKHSSGSEKGLDLFGLPKMTSMQSCNDDNEDEGVIKELATNIRSISVRRVILSSLGLSLSSFITYFWIKVAPLQLAVGFGGTIMIVGGTILIVLGGDNVCDEIGKSMELRNHEIQEERRHEDADDDANEL